MKSHAPNRKVRLSCLFLQLAQSLPDRLPRLRVPQPQARQPVHLRRRQLLPTTRALKRRAHLPCCKRSSRCRLRPTQPSELQSIARKKPFRQRARPCLDGKHYAFKKGHGCVVPCPKAHHISSECTSSSHRFAPQSGREQSKISVRCEIDANI